MFERPENAAAKTMQDILQNNKSVGPNSRIQHLAWQLTFYAEHPLTRFDATFYEREPSLEVTLQKSSLMHFRPL